MVPMGLFHLCCLILCSLQAQRMAGAWAETQLKGSEKCLSKKPRGPPPFLLLWLPFSLLSQEHGVLHGVCSQCYSSPSVRYLTCLANRSRNRCQDYP